MFYYMQLIAFRSVHVDSHTCSVSCISLTFLFFSLFRSHDKWNRMKRGDEGKIQDGEEDLSSYRTACNISEEMIWLRTPKTEIAVYARKLPPFAPNKCNWNSFWYEGLCKLNQNLHPVFTLVITVITIFFYRAGGGRLFMVFWRYYYLVALSLSSMNNGARRERWPGLAGSGPR